jgi:hypothetical protein
MAYYIFLKSLRSLKEFRKMLMSKFLLNLLLQISKALVNSKSNFYFENHFFSLLSARPTLRPARPLAPPAHRPRHPRRPKPSRLAHPARMSIVSSREIRFPFRFTPSRADRLSLVSLSTGPACQMCLPHRSGRPRLLSSIPSGPPRAADL